MATLSKKSPLTGKTDLVTFRLMAKVGGQMKALSEAYQVLDIEVEKAEVTMKNYLKELGYE